MYHQKNSSSGASRDGWRLKHRVFLVAFGRLGRSRAAEPRAAQTRVGAAERASEVRQFLRRVWPLLVLDVLGLSHA